MAATLTKNSTNRQTQTPLQNLYSAVRSRPAPPTSYFQQVSGTVLRVEAGSLYPALHGMTEPGLLKVEWRMSEAGRRARFYDLTAKTRRKLEAHEKKWRPVSAAVAKVLRTA